MITVEDARMIFRNFAGAPDKFNPRGGARNFTLVLEPELAEQLLQDGWNVRELPAREEGDLPTPVLKVKLVFGQVPPKIVIVNPDGSQTPMDEDSVGLLDTAEIETADLVIRPYDWEMHGNRGRTAYLKSLYVTLRETELDRKYRLMAQAQEA